MMKRIVTAVVASLMLAPGLLGAASPAYESTTVTMPACRLFTMKDFRAIFHRPPSAIHSEGHSKCVYFFDTAHRQALLVQVRRSRITARFRPRHLYSHRKLVAVEKRAQRHRQVVSGSLGSTATQGGSIWESFVNQSHWKMIAELLAAIIALIFIVEVIDRRYKRRRAATAAAHAAVTRPVAPPQPYTTNRADLPTREEYEEMWRQERKERNKNRKRR